MKKKDNKCLQHVLTVALRHEKIKKKRSAKNSKK